MTNLQVPPHSIDAEQSVLGGLIRDNNAIDAVGDLQPEHFFRGDHATIFAEILAQIAKGRKVDPISLALSIGGKIEDGQQYLMQLASGMPSAATVSHHAGIVREMATRRALITLSWDISSKAFAAGADAEALLDEAAGRIEKLANVRAKCEPVLASESLAKHVEAIEARIDGTVRAMSTGLTDYDDKLGGGVNGGELHIIGGRPKMGKTAFVGTIATKMAVDYSVLFLSMEMPEAQLHDRNLAGLGRISLPRLKKPALMTEADWAGMTRAIQQIRDMRLFLDDQSGLRLMDVRMKAKAVKRRHGLNVLILDYLQLMSGDGQTRNAQIESITQGLKVLAKELDIAVLCLSQLNRALEQRPNKRPLPSDLRDSGSIEQDADSVTFLYRDEYYDPSTPDKGLLEANVALCRQGAPGTAYLNYIGDQTRVENTPMGWMPAPRTPPSRSFRGGLD